MVASVSPVRLYGPEQERDVEARKAAGWVEVKRIPNGNHTLVVMVPPELLRAE